MKSLIIKSSLGLALVAGLLVGLAMFQPDAALAAPADQVQKGINAAGGRNQNNFGDLIKNIVNILLFIIGIAAVIMIIVGGLRYVLSGGDANATKGAKDTVLYAIVGLIIAFLAYAIINFVTGQFATP